MPRIKMSETCLECMETMDFQNSMCPTDCPEGRDLEAIFDLCWSAKVDGFPLRPCRHIDDCQQDPRTCEYWVDRTYPLEV